MDNALRVAGAVLMFAGVLLIVGSVAESLYRWLFMEEEYGKFRRGVEEAEKRIAENEDRKSGAKNC